MLKNAFNYFDLGYFLRFAALYLLFYLTYTFVVAASAPTGTYYPFVDHFLNFPALIRDSVLAVSQFFLKILGYSTTVSDGYINHFRLRPNSLFPDKEQVSLFMAFPCYGLGVKSFWVAFICAHRMAVKKKIYWSVIGVLTIFLLNCLRVCLMMIAMVDKWSIEQYLDTDAHDFFNYMCYGALLGLILLFYAKTKSRQSSANVVSSESRVAV